MCDCSETRAGFCFTTVALNVKSNDKQCCLRNLHDFGSCGVHFARLRDINGPILSLCSVYLPTSSTSPAQFCTLVHHSQVPFESMMLELWDVIIFPCIWTSLSFFAIRDMCFPPSLVLCHWRNFRFRSISKAVATDLCTDGRNCRGC
jgi:hypothetical protein